MRPTRLEEEREAMASLPKPMPDSNRRFVLRVPPQPYVRVDTCDYSLDPRLVGRRVEMRVGQREIWALALETGELACLWGAQTRSPSRERLSDWRLAQRAR